VLTAKGSAAYFFDLAFRQNSVETDVGTLTRSFDNEDHTIAQVETGYRTGSIWQNASLAYIWGPAGHPIEIGDTAQQVSTCGSAST